MAIIDGELQFFKSAVVADDATNGGRMSKNVLTSGVANNVWPNVMKAERLAGSTKYRKLFAKVSNDADLTLFFPFLWLDVLTPGADWVVFFPGTQTNTQAAITGSERKYGCGSLNADVAAGASTIVVNVEDASLKSGNDVIFVAGDKIRISDKVSPSSLTGNEETHTILSVTPDATLNKVTITLNGTVLANAYTVAANTRVASLYEPGDIKCAVSGWAETTAGGTYDEVLNPLAMDNIGTVQDDWTLTFTDATNFTVAGANSGSVGAGSISADFSPLNADFSKPFFTLAAAGWGGTWAAGNTITFTTSPAAAPLWEKRVIPAGAASLAGDKAVLAFSGESA